MAAVPTKRARLWLNVPEEQFRKLGGEIIGCDPEGRSETVFSGLFLSFFGVEPNVCVTAWDMIISSAASEEESEFSSAKPEHLLWALLFLKKYGDAGEMCRLAGGDSGSVDEKSFRKWSRLFVERIACLLLDVVSAWMLFHSAVPNTTSIICLSFHFPCFFCWKIVWEDRKKGDVQSDCLVSVDGTDCRIPMQRQAPEAFYSHKFNGPPGLRYEVAVCILTGDIVSVVGPFPCGDWPDVEIFRYCLKGMLDEYERVEADDGYVGEDPVNVKVPGSLVHMHDEQQLYIRSRVRRRHETVNKRIKQFKCLDTVFRHGLSFHGTCFRACAVLTQLSIKHGNPLFTVDNYANYF
jgi:hypothetical protein